MQAQGAPNRLSELRKERGVRNVTLASAVGVDQTTYWRWETGRSPIPDEHKLTLAAFYGVTPAYLMGWEGTPA